MNRPSRLLLLFLLASLLLAGCASYGMYDRARLKPLEASSFFPDGSASRGAVENTVDTTAELEASVFTTGRDANGELVNTLPISLTLGVLEQGQKHYDVYCSPCHGLDGYGEGFIVQRGFAPPPSLHDDRLREAPLGHYFEVITNGFGQMYSYAYRVKPGDRWAIAAYIRALQLSQNATMNDVPPDKRP